MRVGPCSDADWESEEVGVYGLLLKEDGEDMLLSRARLCFV